MKTRHINEIDMSGRVYCYRHDKLVSMDSDYRFGECASCPHYADFDSVEGSVTCEFDDACKEGSITFDDAGDSELHSKMQYHRLGMATKEEVLARLQSFNDYSDPEESVDEDDDEGEEDIPSETVIEE